MCIIFWKDIGIILTKVRVKGRIINEFFSLSLPIISDVYTAG